MATLPLNSSWNSIPSNCNFSHTEPHDWNDMSTKEIDQRILASNHPSQQMPSFHLVCGVCGAPATGRNFAQNTCESCKAFFRRNALRDRAGFECRYTGSCVINIQTRRYCAYCRLKKCFAINMRKELIQTEEEIERRRLKKQRRKLNGLAHTRKPYSNLPIVAKQWAIRSTIQDLLPRSIGMNTSFRWKYNLSDNDRAMLNNINNAYQIIDEQAESFRRREWTSLSSVVDFANRHTTAHQSLINFYKLIPDFNRLDLEDRVLLIKSNLIKLILLHFALVQRFSEPPYLVEHMPKFFGEALHQRMLQAYRRYQRFTEHPLVLKLTLIVFIFSISLSAPSSIDPVDDYLNTTHIRRLQEFYVTILWRYLHSLFDEREAIRSMIMIISQILHFQVLINEVETVICHELQRHKLNELELSLLRLTH